MGRLLQKKMIMPRIELGTFCVLSRCHNQLDHTTISGTRTVVSQHQAHRHRNCNYITFINRRSIWSHVRRTTN